jgi:hypothetical protein
VLFRSVHDEVRQLPVVISVSIVLHLSEQHFHMSNQCIEDNFIRPCGRSPEFVTMRHHSVHKHSLE